jgi:hypothetical protein
MEGIRIRPARALRVCVAVATGLLAWRGRAEAATAIFYSDASPPIPISSLAALGMPLGPPERVCLNPGVPVSCSPPANYYNYTGGGQAAGWKADLSVHPECANAKWIWAPGISGTTPLGQGVHYFFQFNVNVPGTPTRGDLYIAVDDFARLYINGAALSRTVGSFTSLPVALTAANKLSHFDISSIVHAGVNTFTVEALNGFSTTCPGCSTYQQDPGGVVFCGSIPFVPNRKWYLPAVVLIFLAGSLLAARFVRRRNSRAR